MKKINKGRILFSAAALTLLLVFVFPLWRITMGIPQYPRDITIHIWINKISNGTEKAMDIMNVLNHNIGMKPIEPESIPELKWFPYIVFFLVGSGILTALLNRRSLRISWILLLILCCGFAMVDFYLWEYDYGNNLDPEAPIKIEGSSFQPPLIGTKNVLNFTVTSLPMTGVIFPVISVLMAGISLIMKDQK